MNPTFEIDLWKRKTISILYHFASQTSLQQLLASAEELSSFVEATLTKSQEQGRDRFLTDPQWGVRNTSDNWANNGWPLLQDFKKSLISETFRRSSEIYCVTEINTFMHASSEFSLQWMTGDEERKYDELLQRISHQASEIDTTLYRQCITGRWTDFGFARVLQEYPDLFRRLPQLRVRTDVEGETGSVPPRTGVYVPQDDIHGAPQFAWRGDAKGLLPAGELLECSTFNEIGFQALKFVGRRELWFSNNRMFAFATQRQHKDRFKQHLTGRNGLDPVLAPTAVARQAFTSRPCKWYLVEMIDGEFEEYDDNTIPA